MEKGNIKIVEIADFKNSEHVLDYVDNDFVTVSYTHLTLPTNSLV